MRWDRCFQIEELFIRKGIEPILGVIPDNRDPELFSDPPRDQFWDHVRSWQSRGWTIGLHGYQHVYVTKSRGIAGGRPRSEFAGLPFEEQYEKLSKALQIFDREEVAPLLWIAPAHAFDKNTLKALVALRIGVVSDGLHLLPHRDREGIFWIPQQLGSFWRLPFGVWTVCVHLDDPIYGKAGYLERCIDQYHSRLTSFLEIQEIYAKHSLSVTNRCFATSLASLKRLRSVLNLRLNYDP
jgi:peptidoglycan/xylan/chitin deacetylase (PgdA/CDA1 family)